jgi:hypothetical protein
MAAFAGPAAWLESPKLSGYERKDVEAKLAGKAPVR